MASARSFRVVIVEFDRVEGEDALSRAAAPQSIRLHHVSRLLGESDLVSAITSTIEAWTLTSRERKCAQDLTRCPAAARQ